jgi:outer membrane murein-binding lipoprotein Lpp
MKRIIFALLVCSLLISGCSKEEPKESRKELEPYVEIGDAKAEDSPYQYLKKIQLQNENISVETYLPISENQTQQGTEAYASLNGISIAVSIKEEKEETAGTFLNEAYQQEYARIHKLKNIQDFKAFDLIEKENYWLMEMDYNQSDGNCTLYPCISIIKMDQLRDGFYLITTLNVDNSKSNEDTKAILEEIMEVYGISIKEL